MGVAIARSICNNLPCQNAAMNGARLVDLADVEMWYAWLFRWLLGCSFVKGLLTCDLTQVVVCSFAMYTYLPKFPSSQQLLAHPCYL